MTEEIPVAKVLIQNSEDKFLVVREKESGKWELPGGLIEEDEDRFESAKREVKEETGLEVSGLEDVLRIELEDDRLVNCYMVYAEDFKGQIETGGDISEARWVTAEEFIEMDWHRDSAYNIPPMKFLDEYLEKEKKY